MDRNFPCGSPDIRLSKQTALLNMFKEPKENVDTELKKKKKSENNVWEKKGPNRYSGTGKYNN